MNAVFRTLLIIATVANAQLTCAQTVKEGASITELGQHAAAGNIDAQFRLAIAYVTGRGVPLDNQKARFWFEKASAGGHAGANQQLYYLDNPSNAIAQSVEPVYLSPEKTESSPPQFKTQTDVAAQSAPTQKDEFRPRISADATLDIQRNVANMVLRNKEVHVSSYVRQGTNVRAHTRQPPGGFTFGDNVEANLWGAAVIAIDYGLQKWDRYSQEKAKEAEQRSK
jgi:hypothetical protein